MFSIFRLFMVSNFKARLTSWIMPIIIIILMGVIAFGINYAVTSYKNLQLENQRLTLLVETQKIQLDLLKEQVNNSIVEIKNIQDSCSVSLKEVKDLYAGKEVLAKKELSVLKSRKDKEKAVKDKLTASNEGTPPTFKESELTDAISQIRIESIYETFCNNNATDLACKEQK